MSVVERAAGALAAARAAFADADALASVSQQELIDLLSLTAELHRVVGAQQIRVAGEIAERSKGPDAESICRHLGGARPRDAIASAFGIQGRQASELLELSELTKQAVSITGGTIAVKYPRVAAALDAGELSVGQAKAIVKTLDPAAPRADLDQLARAEGWLVHSATDPETRLVPELLVTQARAFAAVLDPDGVLPNAERQRQTRGVRAWVLRDGTWKHLVTSPPEEGAIFNAALDAYSSPRVRFSDAPGDAGGDGGGNTGVDEADAAVIDDRTRPQNQFDALQAMVTAHVAAGNAPLAGGEVPRLVLTGTIEAYDAYLQGIDHPDRALTIEQTGGIIPIEAVDRIICDGIVQRAVVDTNGYVLALGREQRTFNRAQRRALAVQYRGCATRTCRAPVSWTEAHHVIWWSHGGPTDTENGILLCNHCHQEVHAGRLQIVGSTGNWRVVPSLRPTDRHARNRRTGQSLRPASAPIGAATLHDPVVAAATLADDARGAIAHAAQPSLTFTLSGPTPVPALSTLEVRASESLAALGLPAPSIGPIERRVRQQLPVGRRAVRRRPWVDRGPPPRIVLRV